MADASFRLLVVQLRLVHWLRLRMERGVRLDPLGDLSERHFLKDPLREGAHSQGVEEVNILHFPVRVDGELRVPTVEGIHSLPGVGADDAVRVREAPGVRVTHHNVDEVHAQVEVVLLPPLQLEPQGPVHGVAVQLLELLAPLLVVQVGVAEDAGVAARFEGFVHNVVEAWPEHLRPPRACVQGAMQCHAHVCRLDAPGQAHRRGAYPQIRLVGRPLLLHGRTHCLPH
mmetsp:Transcript_137328/g.383101  ORF Transcript_137328/g.383101 Transcript_137328/m.383101 type:complete len:228 (+) Transcript_137328:3110-3793(+)